MNSPIRVTVWNEFRHEQHDAKIRAVYPDGIHGAIAAGLKNNGFEVQTATLDEPEHGLTGKAGKYRRVDLVGPRRS